MGRIRVEKFNSLIVSTVSELLIMRSKDPRFQGLTITKASTSPDLRRVRIYYSVLGDEAHRNEVAVAMEKARGYVRRTLGSELSMKYVPEVVFEFDRNLLYAQRINQVLAELKPSLTDQPEVTAESDSRKVTLNDQ
jgi:ribosome-binding factor A